MSAMQTYLAEKYMSGPKADAIMSRNSGSKKKKRKVTNNSSAKGTVIRDEDAGWLGTPMDEDEDEIKDAVVATDRAFKKRKVEGETGGWAVVQEGDNPESKECTPPPAEDEQPQIAGVVLEEAHEFRGGLMSKEQMRKRFGGQKQIKESKGKETEQQDPQETVYRDSSGRKIDMKAEKAEAARRKREQEEKEAKKMEWGKGLVQKEEQEKLRALVEKESKKGFARHADDEDLNDEQKARQLWNDPAAAFLTKKKSKGPRKPEYTGPTPPPNRFGIKPGYRWDGVDRSNGFEAKMYQRINERKRTGAESYSWSVDDM